VPVTVTGSISTGTVVATWAEDPRDLDAWGYPARRWRHVVDIHYCGGPTREGRC
jgi:hypothetical protein